MSMMLITSSWKEGKTFKMIPTDIDCPFVECIYDPQIKVLAVIGVITKDVFHMMPKLDANGDPEMRKTPSRDGAPFKQERRTIETFQEYYVEERSEIEAFINKFADNSSTFNYAQYLDMEPAPMSDIPEFPTLTKS